MVSHHFKSSGSVVSGLTRIKNSSVKCPLSFRTENTVVFKCSHSQNSKGLKSTDCWPAPREQSVCGHKLAWIFFFKIWWSKSNPEVSPSFLDTLCIYTDHKWCCREYLARGWLCWRAQKELLWVGNETISYRMSHTFWNQLYSQHLATKQAGVRI